MTLRKFLHALFVIILFLAVLGLIALYQVNKISSHEWRWHKQLTTFVEQRSTTPPSEGDKTKPKEVFDGP